MVAAVYARILSVGARVGKGGAELTPGSSSVMTKQGTALAIGSAAEA
jgi:hypothetical protein